MLGVAVTCPGRARSQQAAVAGRAGGDDARHFAPDELLALLRGFHLITDRDAMAFGDQLGDVGIGGVRRHAAHRNGLAFFLVASGECDLQVPRGDDRVVKEQLVEIPQPEHQQGVGNFGLDGVVLPHQRLNFALRMGFNHPGMGTPILSEAETCAMAQAVAGAGADELVFYNYGEAPRRSVDWIKPALAGLS